MTFHQKPFLRIVGALLLAAIAAGFLIQRASYYPYVVFQSGDSLWIAFLQQTRRVEMECKATTNRVVEAVLAQCPNCRLIENRCLDQIDTRQRDLLAGRPVDIPTMRTPSGAVAFISSTPGVANEVCQESERYASGKVPARCVAAGVAYAAALTNMDENFSAPARSIFDGSMGLILFAAVMSLVAAYLALRPLHPTRRLNLDSTAEIPDQSGSGVRSATYVLKPCIDYFVAIVLLVLLSPLFAWIAWRIWREDGAPILFVQQRVGLNGKLFDFYKFRSMVHDADATLDRWKNEHPGMWQEYEDGNFKLRDDPRTTEFGKWLRSLSLDELPQLLNVLKGNMSLVGPRPILEREMPYYGGSIDLYSEVRPGITGLWQISGRSNTKFSDRVALDDRYIRNWSLWVDLVILLKTVRVVRHKSGAY